MDCATVAVSQASFAAGRPVAQSMVRVDQHQLAAAPILPHPVVSPERSMVVGAPAHALPPVQARPVLSSHTPVGPLTGGAESHVRLGGTVQQPGPGRPVSGDRVSDGPVSGGAPMPRPAQGIVRAPVDTSSGSQPPVGSNPGRPMVVPLGPRATDPQPMQPHPSQAPRSGPQDAAAPPVHQQPAEAQPVRPQAAATPQQPQQLYNRAVPPEPRPGFDQQRQAMQATDPGRPLSPQQLNNVRQSAPAGPAERQEAPHPPPAAAPMRSTPAPAPASRPAIGIHPR